MKQLGLTTRMALAVSILFIAFVVAMASLTLSFLEKEFKEELARHQFALASSLSDSIDDKLRTAQAALLAAATKVPPDALHNADRAQKFLDDRVTLRAIFGNDSIMNTLNHTLEDLNAFYVVAIDAPVTEQPNTYHSVGIKLDAPGLSARTRTGYYAQP